MNPILTVTLNPALDIAAHVRKLEPRGKLRCRDVTTEPGGGGANVSRAILRLGGTSLAFVAIGGGLGQSYLRLLEADGVRCLPFEIHGETRQSFHVTEDESGAQYRFVLPGPSWSEDDTERVLAALLRHGREASHLVLSGSLPPGVPDDTYRRLAAALGQDGVQVIVDASGPALAAIISGRIGVCLLRMNRQEAEDVAGRNFSTRQDALDLAERLVAEGVAGAVAITMGEEGALLATPEERLHIRPPRVDVVSSVGAGDSFVGAAVLALARGDPVSNACRDGVAAAAATMTTPGSALFEREIFTRIAAACLVDRLPGGSSRRA